MINKIIYIKESIFIYLYYIKLILKKIKKLSKAKIKNKIV